MSRRARYDGPPVRTVRVLGPDELAGRCPDLWGPFGWLTERGWLRVTMSPGDALQCLGWALWAVGRIMRDGA